MSNRESTERVFAGGAIIAALASSLCCILPVVAIAFGLGAFGIASVFESLRPYLLVVAVSALAFSFYQIYFRREKCGGEEACSTKPVGRFNQIVLWIATIAVFAIAAFPYYSGYIVSELDRQRTSGIGTNRAMVGSEDKTENLSTQNKDEAATVESESQTRETIVIAVEGMTCESCASHINVALKRIEGVISAEASYPKKNVTVIYNPKKVTVERIRQGVRDAGYDQK